MIKEITVEFTSEEIADYICKHIDTDDFNTLIQYCGLDKNYEKFFEELWAQDDFEEELTHYGKKFLKRLREELNKLNLD